MGGVQAIVDEILAKRGDLSEDQILQLIEEKKEEGHGLLSDEGAARLVAEELLIQTRGVGLGRMQIKDLVSGLNDVTISGRVLLAWPPQQFQRRDGTLGRVMRIVLVDRSGKTRCALWDRHADLAAKAENLQGRIVRIGHAYTRQGLTSEAEVHAGDRSSIEIDPHLPLSDLPTFRELFTPIGNLQSQSSLNVTGILQVEPRRYTFTKDDRVGSVLRSILADESGLVPVVVWNERAEELQDLKIGDAIQIVNCRTRVDNNGRLEVHVESRSQVNRLSSRPDYLTLPLPHTYKICDVSTRFATVDILVSILAKGRVREIRRSTGETVKVSTLLVGDETGAISISLWDEKADYVNQLNEGDCLQLRNVSVTERSGNTRLSLGRSGQMEKAEPNSKMTPRITPLNAIGSAKGLLIVEGMIADEPTTRQVTTEKERRVDIASFSLKDDSSSTKVTLWREHATFASNLHAGQRVRLAGVRTQTGLEGQLELSSIELTRINLMDAPTPA